MLTDDDIITFGIYRGMPLKDVPDEYLLEFYRKSKGKSKIIEHTEVLEYIKENIDVIMFNIIRNKKSFKSYD